MLTLREKSPLRKMSLEEDRTRDAVDSEPKHYQLSYSGPTATVSSSPVSDGADPSCFFFCLTQGFVFVCFMFVRSFVCLYHLLFVCLFVCFCFCFVLFCVVVFVVIFVCLCVCLIDSFFVSFFLSFFVYFFLSLLACLLGGSVSFFLSRYFVLYHTDAQKSPNQSKRTRIPTRQPNLEYQQDNQT